MRLVVGLLVLSLLVASCGGTAEARILNYGLTDPTTLQVYVDACNADTVLEEVTETATEVRVLVRANRPGWMGGSDCSDGVRVALQDQLGSRTVIDSSSGRAVSTEGG